MDIAGVPNGESTGAQEGTLAQESVEIRSTPALCLVCKAPLPPGKLKYCSVQHKHLYHTMRWESTHRRFLTREVVMWDTEGWGKKVRLIGFNETQVIKREGFTTKELLGIIWEQRRTRTTVHTSFAFGYDANLILGDLGIELVARLIKEKYLELRNGTVTWCLKYVPRKYLSLHPKDVKHAVTIWDTWGFFGCSFVKACQMWGIDLPPIVAEGKALRGSLEALPDDQIMAYNRAECVSGAALITKVMKAVSDMKLPLSRLDGAGALAGAWLRKHCPKAAVRTYQGPEFDRAVLCAYFGGRIDIARCGMVNPCYMYDIVLAYSGAIPLLPDLSKVRWERATGKPVPIHPWGLYDVFWHWPDDGLWNPLPFRAKQHRIIYPPQGRGWHWGIEIQGVSNLNIMNAYLPATTSWEYPLATPYRSSSDERLTWKKAGDPRALLMKNALNSVYGKFAQQVGERGPGRWYQPVFAGWITAYCRSLLWKAIQAVGPEHVVATQTDGIVLDRPLPDMFLGSNPGQWEKKLGRSILLIEPGVYQVYGIDHSPLYERARGFSRGTINYRGIFSEWCDPSRGTNMHDVTVTRFIGAALASQNPKAYGPHWREFINVPRTIHPPWLVGTAQRSGNMGGFSRPATTLLPRGISDLPEGLRVPESLPYSAEGLEFAEDEWGEIDMRDE